MCVTHHLLGDKNMRKTANRDQIVKWGCLSNPSRQQQALLELVANKRANSKNNDIKRRD